MAARVWWPIDILAYDGFTYDQVWKLPEEKHGNKGQGCRKRLCLPTAHTEVSTHADARWSLLPMHNNLFNQIAEGNVFVDPSLCGRLGSNEEMLRVRD